MRAIQVFEPGGPERLVAVDLPEPMPAAQQVRVRAKAIGIGRPDVLIRKGTYQWMPPLPAIPGAELAGVIDALGVGVTQWQVGDRVLVSARELSQRGGCYVEAIAVFEAAPFRLEASISFEDAVSLPNLQLALALMRVAGTPLAINSSVPPCVLITGASGGVATMLSQVAKHQGFTTIGTSRTADKRTFALGFGFDHVLDPQAADLEAQLNTITQGRGLALAFDHLGSQSIIRALRNLASFGTVVSYNVVQGPPSEEVFQVLRSLLGKSLAVRCFSMHSFDQDPALRRELMLEAIALLAQGHVKMPSPTLFSFNQIQHTHELLDQGLVAGKIVIQL